MTFMTGNICGLGIHVVVPLAANRRAATEVLEKQVWIKVLIAKHDDDDDDDYYYYYYYYLRMIQNSRDPGVLCIMFFSKLIG